MTDNLDLLSLPDAYALDAILEEQERTDALILSDPEGHWAPKTPLEGRAEIPALAVLHHRRRVLARALAPMAALFEGGQTPPAEAKRKQHRNLVATLIAQEKNLTGDKIESMLERLANGDERHITFCLELENLRVKYVVGRVALAEVTEEIRDREESLRAYNAELKAGLSGVGA